MLLVTNDLAKDHQNILRLAGLLDQIKEARSVRYMEF